MSAPQAQTALLRTLEAVLAPIHDIRVAYLFGSQASGAARADSDLDIAIALPRELDDLARGRLKLRAIDALTAVLGALGERADVVDLDRAGSAVAFAAIAQGQCVLSRDRVDQVRLEARIARRYDDERPYRELMHAAAIRSGTRVRVGSMLVHALALAWPRAQSLPEKVYVCRPSTLVHY